MKELNLTGSYFDNGCKIGRAGKDKIVKLLKRRKKTFSQIRDKQKSLINFISDSLEKKLPRFIEELRGIAKGSGIDFCDLLLENCPELYEEKSLTVGRCTSVAVKNKKSLFIAHDEDEEVLYDNAFVLLNYRLENDLQYSAFNYFGELPGNAFGWNNFGLFFCVDYLPSSQINLRGMPRFFEARALLEEKSLKSAIEFLKNSRSASGFHYLVGDAKTKKIFSIEKSCNQVSVKEAKTVFSHTNHYIHPKFISLAGCGSKSLERLKIAQRYFHSQVSQNEVLKILLSKLHRPMSKSDTGRTLATVLADFLKQEVYVFD